MIKHVKLAPTSITAEESNCTVVMSSRTCTRSSSGCNSLTSVLSVSALRSPDPLCRKKAHAKQRQLLSRSRKCCFPNREQLLATAANDAMGAVTEPEMHETAKKCIESETKISVQSHAQLNLLQMAELPTGPGAAPFLNTIFGQESWVELVVKTVALAFYSAASLFLLALLFRALRNRSSS